MATAFRRRPLSTANLSWMARRRVSVRPDMPLWGPSGLDALLRPTNLIVSPIPDAASAEATPNLNGLGRRLSPDHPWRIPPHSSYNFAFSSFDSFNLLVNDGLEQTHLHIIPWKPGDQLWPFECFRRQSIESNQEIVDLANTVSDLVSSGPRTIY
ncbi:uncharacterized protein LOC122041247 [Zingiber officinale]|uniref:uncharacterized protein LOC122041247 n=1 Tax=Zingiber officinale TaxID=94328 RepID=UPI001C4BCAA7|nr:uncharacterized protein LOC122041247 [Zingiber officinale]